MGACLDVVLPYVVQRKQFGKPLSQFQMIQQMVADMQTRYESSRALVYSAATKLDTDTKTSVRDRKIV